MRAGEPASLCGVWSASEAAEIRPEALSARLSPELAPAPSEAPHKPPTRPAGPTKRREETQMDHTEDEEPQ